MLEFFVTNKTGYSDKWKNLSCFFSLFIERSFTSEVNIWSRDFFPYAPYERNMGRTMRFRSIAHRRCEIISRRIKSKMHCAPTERSARGGAIRATRIWLLRSRKGLLKAIPSNMKDLDKLNSSGIIVLIRISLLQAPRKVKKHLSMLINPGQGVMLCGLLWCNLPPQLQ